MQDLHKNHSNFEAKYYDTSLLKPLNLLSRVLVSRLYFIFHKCVQPSADEGNDIIEDFEYAASLTGISVWPHAIGYGIRNLEIGQ
jgi:L-arabinose isomerase